MVHETIELWGRGEYRGEVGDGFAPSIETYVLDGGQRRGAVLICPGGGYGYLSPREAEPVALQFNAAGYHAFILSYSVAPRRYPLSLLDASKAICLLRSRADAWKIHPGRIALCGFSAGAHLAASLGVYWDKPVTQEAAPTATSAAPGAASAAATEAAPGAASAAAPGKPEAAPTAPGGRARGIKGLEPGYNRPDALILSYPVITSGPFAHRGSFENLLGSDPSAELLEEVSLELHVSEKKRRRPSSGTRTRTKRCPWRTASSSPAHCALMGCRSNSTFTQRVRMGFRSRPRKPATIGTTRIPTLLPGCISARSGWANCLGNRAGAALTVPISLTALTALIAAAHRRALRLLDAPRLPPPEFP